MAAGPIDSAAALRDARAMLGRGTRESGGPPGLARLLVGLLSHAGRRQYRAPRPERRPQHGSNCRPQPPFPRKELCWDDRRSAWRTVPDEERVAPRTAGSAEDYEAAAGSLLSGGVDARVAGASGILGLERIVATRRAHPEVVVAANDRVTREALGLLPGESLSVQRHARELLIPQAGNFSTLKRMAIMIAGALDEGRQRGSVHQHALLWHMYRVVESAALSETRDLEFGWPLLGLPDPCGVARPGLAPIRTGCLPSRSQCSRCGSSWTRARSRTRNWRERDRGSRGRCWTSSGQGGCQGGSAGRRAGQEAAAGRGKRRWWSWERRGRHHERLRKPTNLVVLAAAARKRRTAERPDQTLAVPR